MGVGCSGMKLLFDENLPPSLVGAVQDQYPGSAHVHNCGLGASDDAMIWEYAKDRDFIIVTKDSDYEQRSILLGAPPKVLWLRTGNCTTRHLTSVLAAHAGQIEAFAGNRKEVILVIA